EVDVTLEFRVPRQGLERIRTAAAERRSHALEREARLGAAGELDVRRARQLACAQHEIGAGAPAAQAAEPDVGHAGQELSARPRAVRKLGFEVELSGRQRRADAEDAQESRRVELLCVELQPLELVAIRQGR